MKHLSKLAAIFAALVLACAFVGCSDGSDDSTSTAAYVGTYECSSSPEDGVNVSMTLVTKDDGTFTMTQAVTYPGGSDSDTITGTYKVSGTTVTISYEDEGETVSLTGTTSDNWKTIVVDIPASEGEDSESYTFTKK